VNVAVRRHPAFHPDNGLPEAPFFRVLSARVSCSEVFLQPGCRREKRQENGRWNRGSQRPPTLTAQPLRRSLIESGVAPARAPAHIRPSTGPRRRLHSLTKAHDQLPVQSPEAGKVIALPPRRSSSRVRAPGSVNSPLDHTLLRPVSTSEHEAECPEERILFVLPLPQDPWASSHRCVATFCGRADHGNWRRRPLLQRPNGLFIKDRYCGGRQCARKVQKTQLRSWVESCRSESTR